MVFRGQIEKLDSALPFGFPLGVRIFLEEDRCRPSGVSGCLFAWVGTNTLIKSNDILASNDIIPSYQFVNVYGSRISQTDIYVCGKDLRL